MGRTDTGALGSNAEALALTHLLRHGLKLIARNFRCRLGEIDLIMTDGNCLVFVEVRYRHSNNPVSAVQSIGPAKQRRLAMAGALFLGRRREYSNRAVRFDVVAMDGELHESVTIRWIRDAFRPGF